MIDAVAFVRGHCGWDTVTLVPEGQIPSDQELASGIKIVTAPVDGGLEAGFMGFGATPDEICLRMVSSTDRNWIEMCGGMTQVIGKALVETFLRDHFAIDVSRPMLRIRLQTPSGEIPIRIDIRDGRAVAVTTTMDRYVAFCYEQGIESLRLRETPVLRVGRYAVLNVADLERVHPDMDFTRRDFGPSLEVVHDVLREFQRLLGMRGVTAMLFDARPEGPGQYRVFPRFYSDDLAAARIPWEFQCGTGCIAVAIALAHEHELPFETGSGTIVLEWGSHKATPDPYGIRTSELSLDLSNSRVLRAAFSHSVVEILAEGRLRLPNYAVAL